MESVWIVEGWFGDHDWIEAVCASQELAESIANQRWADRRSHVLPADHYNQGLCKFQAVEHPLLRDEGKGHDEG